MQLLEGSRILKEEELELHIQNDDTLSIGDISYVYGKDTAGPPGINGKRTQEYLRALNSLGQTKELIVLTQKFLVFDEKGKAYRSLEEIEQQTLPQFKNFEKTLSIVLNGMQKHETETPEVNIQFIGTLQSTRGPCQFLPGGGRRWEQITYFEVDKVVLGTVAVNSIKINLWRQDVKDLIEGSSYLVSLHVNEQRKLQLQRKGKEFWELDELLFDEINAIEKSE